MKTSTPTNTSRRTPLSQFKVGGQPQSATAVGAWDEHGHNLLPDLLAHKFVGDFEMTHSRASPRPTPDTQLGKPYDGGPLWLLIHGEIEYFTANSMYAARKQIGTHRTLRGSSRRNGKCKRVMDEWVSPQAARAR